MYNLRIKIPVHKDDFTRLERKQSDSPDATELDQLNSSVHVNIAGCILMITAILITYLILLFPFTLVGKNLRV